MNETKAITRGRFTRTHTCFMCGDEARQCDGVPLQVGHIYFCSQECMKNYLVAKLRIFNEVDSF